MKIPITLVFLISVYITSGCQESKFSLGIALCPTINSLYGNEFTRDIQDPRLSLFAGINADYMLNNIFGIRTGMGFERKGNQAIVEFTTATGEPAGQGKIKHNFDYLTVPILIRFNTKQKIKFYFVAGPYIGFLVNRTNIVREETIDVKEDFSTIDLGLHLGLGLLIPLSEKLELDVGLREELGLINTSELPVYDDGAVRTNSFGVVFGLKCLL